MPYIGRGPAKSGAFRILDDISGDFNGSTTSFALEVGSAALTVGLPETLTISVDGVIQEAGSAYTISGSNIVFTAAPQADATFWGVELGDVGGQADRATTQSASDNSTKVATTAYVDAQVATEDTLAEMGDVNLTSPGDAAVLIYDTGTSTWRDAAVSGDATIGDTGAVTVASSHSGSAHHADSHTVASHSDTTGTGAELETLTDGSTTALHVHAARKLDDLATPDDNTDLNVSTSRHGLVPKITSTSNFLKGDGTWAVAAAPANLQEFSSPGSGTDWTKPSTGTQTIVMMVGAGGGGGGGRLSDSANHKPGGGGGGGSIRIIETYDTSDLGSTVTVTIGAGGTGGSGGAAAADGTGGGNTTFGSHSTAYGGGGGAAGADNPGGGGGGGALAAGGSTTAGSGGTGGGPEGGTGGDPGNNGGSYGGAGGGNTQGADGGNGIWGGGGGSSYDNTGTAPSGGSSVFGSAGGGGGGSMQASGSGGAERAGGAGGNIKSFSAGGGGAGGAGGGTDGTAGTTTLMQGSGGGGGGGDASSPGDGGAGGIGAGGGGGGGTNTGGSTSTGGAGGNGHMLVWTI